MPKSTVPKPNKHPIPVSSKQTTLNNSAKPLTAVHSSSDSEDSSDSEHTLSKAIAANGSKLNGNAKQLDSEDDDDTSDSEDSDEDERPKPAAQVKAAVPSRQSVSDSSSSDSDSSDSDSDSKNVVAKPAQSISNIVKQQSVNESDHSSSSSNSDSSDDEDVPMAEAAPVPTVVKRKAEDDTVGAQKKIKVTNGPAVPSQSNPADESTKVIFVGNLSWSVDNDRLAQEFAECGRVVSARVQLDRNSGKSRGFGYVTFATSQAVQAAIALQGTKDIDGRTLNIDRSVDNGGNREKRAQVYGDSRSTPTNVLFVGNLSWDSTEDSLWEIFKEHGEVDSVRLPTDRESGRPKGYGYVEYSSVDSAKAAIGALNGQEIDGRPIRLDYSAPRDSNGGGRGGRGGGGGRGSGSGFGNSRGGGGFGGGRGHDGGRGGRGSRGRGRGGDRGGGRGGRGAPRGGARTGAIIPPAGKKTTF